MTTYKELLVVRDEFLIKQKILAYLSRDPEITDIEEDSGTGDLIITFRPSNSPRTVRVITKGEPAA